jgi:hypothetical protein
MRWTDEQWTTFCALLEEWWPGDFDGAARAAWRVALDGMEPEAASETAQRMLLQGRRFRPSVSEFLTDARQDPSRPTFDETLVLLRRAMKAADPAERLGEWPIIAAFVERQGWDRLRNLPLDDPDWGEKTRRELREAWDRHVEAFDGREVAALASGDRDGLRQLDPLASLGVKPLEIERAL